MEENVILCVCNMLAPITMLILGLVIWKTMPGYGDMFGYRTTYSLKNPELWNIAQYCFGKSCTITFAVMSFLSLFAGLVPIFFEVDKEIPGFISAFVTLIQVVALFVIIFITEHKLKVIDKQNAQNKEKNQ